MDPHEQRVQGSDLPPVGLPGLGGLGVERGDRSLKRIDAGPAGAERVLGERDPLADLPAVPEPAILVFQEDQFAVPREASGPPRVVQQHQGQQGVPSGLRGQQFDHEAPEADRFIAQLHPQERVPGGRRVPFGEHEVDRRQDPVDALPELFRRRRAVRDPRVADLALCAHEPLGHRRLGHEEDACDLGGGQTAERAQRQRDLRLEAQRRVTAGEDQPQPVVLHVGAGSPLRQRTFLLADERLEVEPGFHAGPPPQPVERLVAGRAYQPGARARRLAVDRPTLQRQRVRVLQRVLRDVEIADQPDQRGQDPSVLGALDLFE